MSLKASVDITEPFFYAKIYKATQRSVFKKRRGEAMALSRSMLKGMGLTEEQVSAIIEAHSDTMEALKNQRNEYKEKAEKYDSTKAELDNLKEQAAGGNEWEAKYNSEHEAFENYKAEQATAKVKADKVSAYKQLLKDAGVSENRIDSIMKITSVEEFEIKDGKLTNEEDIKNNILEEWKDFIVKESAAGAKTENPPGNSNKDILSKEDIYKTDEKGRYVLSTEERQKALAQLNSSK